MSLGHKHSGFTLVELMIVTAVIAILAAVAYPAYTEQVRNGRRAEARAHLMQLLQQQERFQTQRNTYQTFATTGNTDPFKNFLGNSQAASTHVFGAQACQALNGTVPATRDCIEVFAQPNTNYSDPGVTLMAIDTMGRRRCTGTSTDRCWR